jgi:hypothetical protein
MWCEFAEFCAGEVGGQAITFFMVLRAWWRLVWKLLLDSLLSEMTRCLFIAFGFLGFPLLSLAKARPNDQLLPTQVWAARRAFRGRLGEATLPPPESRFLCLF